MDLELLAWILGISGNFCGDLFFMNNPGPIFLQQPLRLAAVMAKAIIYRFAVLRTPPKSLSAVSVLSVVVLPRCQSMKMPTNSTLTVY